MITAQLGYTTRNGSFVKPYKLLNSFNLACAHETRRKDVPEFFHIKNTQTSIDCGEKIDPQDLCVRNF